MTKSNRPSKRKSIDITLRDLAVPKKVPWSAFVLLIILYVITSFLTSKCATTPGSVQFLDKVIPYNAFAGVFTSLSNLCVMFLVLLFRKPGYIVSMIFLCVYQIPMLIINFMMRDNVNAVAGTFSNVFSVVAITIIYVMFKKDQKLQRRLHDQAVTDRLTKLPNRFACRELMERLIRKGEEFALVSIDITNFKSINDTMGHAFGDKVLIEVGNRWKELADSGKTGTNDFIGRLGGDEYAMIIRNYDSEEELLETIGSYKAELEKTITIEDCDYYVSANFGYSEYPAEGESTNELLSGANAAMHEAGRAGTTSILKYSNESFKIDRTMEIERKIRLALENDTIFFNLQPQYDISHRLRGFEALARMKDENGEFISPAEFIPVAEKTGLVDRIDAAVFRKAAKFLSEVLDEKIDSHLTISTNVSVRHLMKNNFLDETREIIETYQIPADRIEIEITESIMIDSTEKALSVINELKNMGIKIAIDDFGTGYSSLSYLNSLPSDMLKIDKSFIDVMNDSESTKEYVAMIISIGHILHLEVISEGVESPEQIETLRKVGCDYIQGYVWGRPMSPEDAMTLALEA